jgi:hypothetical protein
MQRKPWTAKAVREAVALIAAGSTHAEAAAAVGRPGGGRMLGKYWRRANPRHERRPGLTPERRELLARWHAAGWALERMAARLAASVSITRRWLKALGLAMPDRRRASRPRPARVAAKYAATRLENSRLACDAMGWPEATRPMDARVLSLLEAGPKTAAELAQALGYRLGGPFYRLVALRLVECVGRRGRAKLWGVAGWLLASRGEGKAS